MKKILILYPHFPPSNLAGVHRPRLFAQHLPTFGWEPVILTVHEKYYEETPDWNLVKLLPPNLRIEKTRAFGVGKIRVIGDIGLRAFFQLYRKAKSMIVNEKFDFLFIPIPSFYCALLGRVLHSSTGIQYGIDYIDPWVHYFPGSEKKLSRHWFSTQLAKLLEPIAVKKASLITGVAEGYYAGVLKRNPHLTAQTVCGGMPYGGEERDHEMLHKLGLEAYLFKKKPGKVQLVYAGAMLPKAYKPLEAIFKSISVNKEIFRNVEFHFIGTGSRVDDDNSYNIKGLAEKYGLYGTNVFEYPKRIPYLDVLVHLNTADGIFILGSTEPHYTPSKIYQAVLSGKPIAAVLHSLSTGVSVINASNAGQVLAFDGLDGIVEIENSFKTFFEQFLIFYAVFDRNKVKKDVFQQYSAAAVTRKLAALLDSIDQKK